MKTIGILGGVGPLATADLFKKLVLMTDAKCDQEHLRILIDNNPSIPDRTAAILHNKKSPLNELIETAKHLEQMGAELLIMPCNTAHYYYDEIVKQINIQMLNMIELAADAALRSGCKNIGLLATEGTLKTRLYHDALIKRGLNPVEPPEQGVRAVMGLIYDGVKANNHSYDISEFLLTLEQMKKAEVFMLACTELPVAFSMYKIDKPALDPTKILAQSAIIEAGGRLLS